MSDERAELPGLDLERLAGWLAETRPGLVHGPLRGRLIAGGKSNLTYEIGDGTSAWIVRRPPLGHVLATAHDMAREYRVISALAGTGVPVPATYALCEDTEIIGAPFYVMERVLGTPYRTAAELVALGRDRTAVIATGLIDTLAALHTVDPVAVGLADFGRPDGFLERQVRRWRKQLDASYSRDLPAADELHELLTKHLPAQSPTGIVHGDYRLDNVLVDDADRVAAVIDWEMATLGDPLTDIGLLLVYQRMSDSGLLGVSDVALAPGYPTESQVLERYSASTVRDLSGIGFYVALASFKLAVISEGIYFRFTHGQTVGSGFEHFGEGVDPLLQAGLAALRS
ncbi:phosphotransferase family protein [Nocardia seriolae]|uniref:Acyl-CoA dehydrogenase family member n=1 Tax=Nocardia seriolae TaxID=37332 RepID=A0ABC8AV72_9NOCA|nr:phosphotransferase family protein [Nocardia seriolae]APA97894.1 Acyl-CoA dehydrogenase family member [Nocardia seriolae]OJF79897.1 acyl-CoA dehydrogenase [Nocardia seriolae]PSK29191.1 phosphotransferase family protein [Nocardia seriolae]QOW36160.1 phosphotransferase family protein [Nocardia seriolae]QUN16336.1 phosphotransferase family protein [Nocardia seriolae]